MFDHEKLDVYKTAIQFVIIADEITQSLLLGKGYLADQLRRASSSISLNIAEGPGLLVRIVSMLIKMAQITNHSGAHTGTGTNGYPLPASRNGH